MRRIFSKALCVLFVAAIVCSCAVPAFAQSATTGAVGGTIYDPSGSVLAGVQITVLNVATGETRSTVTRASGEYRITDLPPGTYTVTVTAPGFQTYKAVQVPVALGSVSDIAPKLVVGNVSETVEVTDDAPLMHTQSSEVSSIVDQNMIDNLPINGRRYSNFALLTPGVVSNSDGFGLISFRGVNYLLNNSTVDGLDDNQAYFSEQRGRTRVSYSISQAAVQEFQVNTSNYSAEYGRAAGGVINTVTKSGGNKIHGEMYFFDRDNEFGSTNPYTTTTTEQPLGSGIYVTNAVKPKNWRKTWGFGVGGPLIHDKLFLFYAYDQQRRNFPGISRFSQNAINQGVFAKAYPVLTGSQACVAGVYTSSTGTKPTAQPQNQSADSGNYAACQVANALGVSYSAGVAYYQQGLGIIQSFTGLVPRRADQVINFPRLDWQISEKNRLTLQYNRLRSSSPNGFQTQASNTLGTHSFGDDFVKTDFAIARLATVLSQSLVNELRFQFGRDFEYSNSNPPGPNELSLVNTTPGTPSAAPRPPYTTIGYFYDSSNQFHAGKSPDQERYAQPNERRLQAEDILTWSHGKHTLKAGIDINRVFDFVNNLYEESGSYRYNYSAPFIADYLHATTGIGGTSYAKQYYQFAQGFGNPITNIATTDYAGFATDDWRILPRLTLTLGVRYEYEYIPPNPSPMVAGTPVYSAGAVSSVPAAVAAVTNFTPDDRNNVQPRIGFSLDVYGDGKTYLRGGYGLYNGRIINSAIGDVYNGQVGAGSQQAYSATSCSGLLYPNISTSEGAYNTSCSNNFGPQPNYFNKHMQLPQVHEVDLALEQNLGWNTVLAVMYMASLGRELESTTDQNNDCFGDFAGQNGGTCSSITKQYVVVNADSVTPVPANYVTLPHGGRPSPMAAKGYATGSIYSVTPFYTGTQPYPIFDSLLKVSSNVNSSYNALAVQLNKRMSHGLSFNANYTWSHSLDYNPFIGTGTTFAGQYDPANFKDEYGNGQLDVRDRFVASAVFRPQTHFHGWAKYAGNNWQVSPILQMQTGLPYTPSVTGTPSGGEGGSINGSGGVNVSGLSRLLVLGRNQSYFPKTAVVDLRLSKRFYLPSIGSSRPSLELDAQVFNLLNHQNITQMATTAYCLNSGSTTSATPQNCPGSYTVPSGTLPLGTGTSSPQTNAPYLIAQPNYGTYTNSNSTNFNYTTRQIEISGRLYF
jgi:outer membrane receptor protein involved in Fe transport